MTNLPPFIADSAKQLVEARRETMRPEDAAIFDLMVLVELARRGLAHDQFYLELRVKAEEHRARAPYVAALMKTFAAQLAPPNVVSLHSKPTHPGANP